MPLDLAKTPSFRLDGKRALVTGGGRGIGLAAASALAAAGAQVTLAARTKSEIEQAALSSTPPLGRKARYGRRNDARGRWLVRRARQSPPACKAANNTRRSSRLPRR